MRIDLFGLVLSVILLFLGLAIARVGFVGQHLGRFRLVSYVKKYSDEPQSYHRYITIGIGVVAILIGTADFIFVLISFSKQK